MNSQNNNDAINWLKSILCGDDMDDLINESFSKIKKDYDELVQKKQQKKENLNDLDKLIKNIKRPDKTLSNIKKGDMSDISFGYKGQIRNLLKSNNDPISQDKQILELLTTDYLRRKDKLSEDRRICKEFILKYSEKLDKLNIKLEYRKNSILYGLEIIKQLIILFLKKKWISYIDSENIMEQYIHIRIESDDYRDFKKQICIKLIKIIKSNPNITQLTLARSLTFM